MSDLDDALELLSGVPGGARPIRPLDALQYLCSAGTWVARTYELTEFDLGRIVRSMEGRHLAILSAWRGHPDVTIGEVVGVRVREFEPPSLLGVATGEPRRVELWGVCDWRAAAAELVPDGCTLRLWLGPRLNPSHALVNERLAETTEELPELRRAGQP